jgi:hypothetical protein
VIGQHQGQRKEEDLSVHPEQPEHLFIPRKAKKPKHEFIKFSYDISLDSPSRKLGLPSIGSLEGEQVSNTRAPIPHRESPPEDFNSSGKAVTDAATRTGMYIPTQIELLSIELSLYIFRFNESFGRVLLVLHTTILSMFGKFLVHAWSRRGGLNEEHSRNVSVGAKLI